MPTVFWVALAAPLRAGAEQGGKDMLILGMGTGTFAVQTERYFPGNHITGVEIDQKITDLARAYFALPEEIPVTTYDGRAYLYGDKNTYDVIMVDAYQDITIPFQMSSVEFFTMVREHLNPGGVMVVNMNMHSEEPGNINEYLADTIASVFPAVATVDVPGTTNRELFAAMDKGVLAPKHLYEAEGEKGELETLMDRVMEMAQKMLANAPIAISLAKQSIGEGYDLDADAAIALENDLFGQCFATADQKEGMDAFLNKRKAAFTNN